MAALAPILRNGSRAGDAYVPKDLKVCVFVFVWVFESEREKDRESQ